MTFTQWYHRYTGGAAAIRNSIHWKVCNTVGNQSKNGHRTVTSSRSEVTGSFIYRIRSRSYPGTCLFALHNSHLMRFTSARSKRLRITFHQPQFIQETLRLIWTSRLLSSKTICFTLVPDLTLWYHIALQRPQGQMFTSTSQRLLCSGTTEVTKDSLKFCPNSASYRPIYHHRFD